MELNTSGLKLFLKKRNSKVLLFFLVFGILLIISGSYAVWHYTFESDINTIDTGYTKIEFTEDNDVINLQDALPESDTKGKTESPFEFIIKTKSTHDPKEIDYSIVIEKLETSIGYLPLTDSQMKVYLTDEDDNILLEPTLVSELDNYTLYSKRNNHLVNNVEVKDHYKLRLWIDKDADAKGWTDISKYQYKFRVNVKAEQPSRYTITFNPNEGEVVTSSKIITNKGVYGALPTPTRANWVFDGWYTSVTGGTKVTNETIANLSSNQTLYARWKDGTQPNTPTITRIDYNTFTYSATDNVGVTGYKITTTSTKPSATDSGWVTTTSYDVPQSSNTYYVWAKDAAGNISASKSIATYLVTRSVGTGTTLTTKLESSTGTAITANTYVLSGTPVYIIGALNTGYNSLTITVGGSAFTSGNIKTITSATTIASSATINSYTITYNYSENGGTSATTTTASVNHGSAISFTPTAVKSGWAFIGWNTNKNATTKLTSLNAISNTTLYAIYKKEAVVKTSTFYYYDAGIKTTTGTCTIPEVYNNNVQETNCTITSAPQQVTTSTGKYSSTYTGLSSAVSNMSNASSLNGGTNYYATYRKSVTNYYYDSSWKSRTLYRNEIFTSASATSSVLSSTTTGTSNISTSTGPGSSTFIGFATTATSQTATYATVSAAATSEATTLYTLYQNNVTYNKGDNIASIGATTGNCKVIYNQTGCNVTGPTITPNTGYGSAYWGASSTSTSGIAPSSSIAVTTNNTTFYGIVKANTYTVTFDANEGTVGTSTKTVTYASTYGTLPIPTRANWIFNGWYTSTTGGTKITSSSNVTITSNQTLYARWQDDTTPSLSVSVPNGTTYAKTKTATVALTDTLSGLSSTAKTIRYVWSTTAPTQTCNATNYPNEITITPTNGSTSKTGTITINEGTGAGKLYICNSTNITDVYGNILTTSYKNDNMYLDNTDPNLTFTKDGVISDFKGWELTNEASIEDNILTMDSLSSTALSPFYQVSEENYRWEFEVYTTSVTTASTTKGGFYVGWRYYDSSFNSYVASNGYSGNGQARSVELNTWTPFTTAAKPQYGYGTGVEYFKHSIAMNSTYSTPTTKYRNYKMHGENLYSKEKYTITLDTSDANTSIATKKYASGNENASYFANSGTNITDNSFEITENGTYTIYVADTVGNYKLETVTINKIDKTAPSISAAAETNNNYETSKTITATATDSVAGIVAYQFTETNEEPTNWITINTAKTAKTVTTTATSNKTYYVWFVDGAGNVSSEAIPVTHVDTTAPNTPTIIRSDYNTFTYSATDNAGVTGYKITTTSTKPSATDSGWVTTTNYDVSQSSNTYYVWAKDAVGNISASKSIAAYLVTRSVGTGTNLTTKLESSTGTAITSNTYVLSGTPIYILGTLNTGYNSLSITVGGAAFTSGNIKTITSATTIASSATINIYTVSATILNGTIDGDTQKVVEYNNNTSFTFIPTEGYNNATISCTNGQTATMNENILTTGNITNNTVCTVSYNLISYDITYIANTPEGTTTSNLPGPETKTMDTDLTLTSITPTNDQNKFLGWSTTAEATTTDTWYDPSDTYTANEDVSLYAQWYDTNTLENSITGKVRGGDFTTYDLAISKKIGAFAASTTSNPMSLSGYKTLGTYGYTTTGSYRHRAHWYGNIATGTTGNRNMHTSAMTLTYTKQALAVLIRTGSVTEGTIDEQIQNMQRVGQVNLSYDDLLVQRQTLKTQTAPTINNCNSAAAYDRALPYVISGYTYISPVGHVWTNAASGGQNAHASHAYSIGNVGGVPKMGLISGYAGNGILDLYMDLFYTRTKPALSSITTTYTPDETTYGSIGAARLAALQELNTQNNSFFSYEKINFERFNFTGITTSSSSTTYDTSVTFTLSSTKARIIGIADWEYGGGTGASYGVLRGVDIGGTIQSNTNQVTVIQRTNSTRRWSNTTWYYVSGIALAVHVLYIDK